MEDEVQYELSIAQSVDETFSSDPRAQEELNILGAELVASVEKALRSYEASFSVWSRLAIEAAETWTREAS